MAVNADAKMGFYTALGVLAALLVWNFVSSRIPSIREFNG